MYSLDVERVDAEGEGGQLSPLYPTFQHSTPSEQPMRYIAMHLHVALLCFCTLLCVAPHNSVQCSMHSTLCGAVHSHTGEIFCDQQTNTALLPIQLFCICDICLTKNINSKNVCSWKYMEIMAKKWPPVLHQQTNSSLLPSLEQLASRLIICI